MAPTLDAGWDVALRLAWRGYCAGTTPVGAVVVAPDGAVVASGRGRRYETAAPAGQLAGGQIAHGEINALAQLGSHRHWEDHALLTTLEPCGMCHGAAIQATVGQLLYAAPDPYGGTARLALETPQSRRRPVQVTGPLTDERGAFATLLHIAWLLQRPSAAHVVDLHRERLPALTALAQELVESRPLRRGDEGFDDALRHAKSAPRHELEELAAAAP